MANLGQVIIFSLLGGVVSLIGGILLLSSRKTAEKLAVYATPFAGGALLAAVFLDLLKEGVESSPIETVMIICSITLMKHSTTYVAPNPKVAPTTEAPSATTIPFLCTACSSKRAAHSTSSHSQCCPPRRSTR